MAKTQYQISSKKFRPPAGSETKEGKGKKKTIVTIILHILHLYISIHACSGGGSIGSSGSWTSYGCGHATTLLPPPHLTLSLGFLSFERVQVLLFNRAHTEVFALDQLVVHIDQLVHLFIDRIGSYKKPLQQIIPEIPTDIGRSLCHFTVIEQHHLICAIL